jgi:TRAP-type mannitol/chloroaromatic compound transport system permease large subunit
MALFMGYIGWWSTRHPEKMPPADPPTSLRQKIRASGNLIPCTALIIFIVWVLVAGYATATECAAYGVVGSLAIAAWGRSLTVKNFMEGLMGATRTSLPHQDHGLHRRADRSGRVG